jgi:serine/threonine protein kinase
MPVAKNIAIGDIVAGKYRLLDIIGEGGMGVVYLAEHTLIEKRIALKVLRSEYSSKPEVVGRFQQEAISASRIKHPNVLDVFDFGKLEDGSFFLAMEYLQGRDLAGELSESTTIVPERALRIAMQMTRALAAAHARGVVHRDLKPENVFLHQTEDGDEIVKIVDFGIAQLKGKEDGPEGPERRRRLTRTGMIFGTPEYMSPEQAAGRSIDLRSDIYAVGVMLYEMFTGAVPFTGASFMAVLSAHLTQAVPPMRRFLPELSISAELEAAVMKALQKEPDARFQSMRELSSALQLTPECRAANPLSGLLPVPEVTVSSFRPARGAGPLTSPQFNRSEPLPFDLVSRGDVSDPRNPKPVVTSTTRVTRIDGTTDAFWGNEAKLDFSPESRGELQGQPQSRAKWIGLGVAVLLAIVGGLFGYYQYQIRPQGGGQSRPEKTATSQAVGSEDTRSVEPSTPDARDVPSANPVASQPVATVPSAATNPTVVITVQTNLPGATISKDGFQVCDKTPCAVEMPRGAATELVATKGYAKGVAKVLAQKDQTVTINLVFPKAGGKKNDAGKPGLCEVTVDGLKILRPCQ